MSLPRVLGVRKRKGDCREGRGVQNITHHYKSTYKGNQKVIPPLRQRAEGRVTQQTKNLPPSTRGPTGLTSLTQRPRSYLHTNRPRIFLRTKKNKTTIRENHLTAVDTKKCLGKGAGPLGPRVCRQ